MDNTLVIVISAAVGVALCLTLWGIIYLATGRFFPVGILISIAAAIFIGLRLSERLSRGS